MIMLFNIISVHNCHSILLKGTKHANYFSSDGPNDFNCWCVLVLHVIRKTPYS